MAAGVPRPPVPAGGSPPIRWFSGGGLLVDKLWYYNMGGRVELHTPYRSAENGNFQSNQIDFVRAGRIFHNIPSFRLENHHCIHIRGSGRQIT